MVGFAKISPWWLLCARLFLAQKFECSLHCQAFESVKSFLCPVPVLAAPQMDQPLNLYVDAGKVGAGAVLVHTNQNGASCELLTVSVSYFSKNSTLIS